MSDFWLDQTFVYAQRSLAGDQLERFERMWRRARRSVVRPKLLVLLRAPPEMLAPAAADPRRTTDELDELQAGLRRLAMEKDQGPVLQLDAARPERAAAEVAAAIQAMRPTRPANRRDR